MQTAGTNRPNEANDANEASNEQSKLFSCCICMDTPSDPVITPCGHLFCWGCLVNWLDLGHDDCPVCKGHVTRDNVTPIYGVDGNNKDPRSDSHTPKRPSAHYEESDHTVRNNRAQNNFFNGIPGFMFSGLMFPGLMNFRFGNGNFSFGLGMPMFSGVSLILFLVNAAWNWYRNWRDRNQQHNQNDQPAQEQQHQAADSVAQPVTNNMDATFITLIVIVLILYTLFSYFVC